MRSQYDFSKRRHNPYVKKLKQPVTIRLDQDSVEYFKGLADELNIPYQTLINLYLADCANEKRKPSLRWVKRVSDGA